MGTDLDKLNSFTYSTDDESTAAEDGDSKADKEKPNWTKQRKVR